MYINLYFNRLILLVVLFMSCFSSFVKAETIESIIQDSIQTVYVKRDVNEKDIILVSKIHTLAPESQEVQDVAVKLRKEIMTLFLNRPNVLPILEEKLLTGGIKFPIENYSYFKNNNISYILSGDLRFENSIFYLNIKIFDSYKTEKIFDQNFQFSSNEVDIFSQKLTTQIYEFLTGEFGFFYGKLLYTITDRPGVRPFKKIILSKREGNSINATIFADGVYITFNPHYCPKTKEVFYVSQKLRSHSEILIANRSTGKVSKLNIPQFKNKKYQKSVFSPDTSNDCNSIVFSILENGKSGLFLFDRSNKKLTSILNQRGVINTAPKFFNFDREIVFVSDYTGIPKIWQINTDGTGRKMISKNKGSYYSPSVSNDNTKLAFVKVENGQFYIGVSNLDGSNEELLYSGFLIEDPVWSPIGKTIIFSMKAERDSKSRIYAISLNGREPEELDALSGNATEPAWVDEF